MDTIIFFTTYRAWIRITDNGYFSLRKLVFLSLIADKIMQQFELQKGSAGV